MHSSQRQNVFFAPMGELSRNWVESQKLGPFWFFETLSEFKVRKVVFDRIEPGSILFQKIIECGIQAGFEPVFCLPVTALEKAQAHSSPGISFVFLIHRSLDAQLTKQIRDLELDQQFSFVVVVRKDWEFENALRSLPTFVTQDVFADIPLSLVDSDPFARTDEGEAVEAWLSSEFDWLKLKYFSPDLTLRGVHCFSNVSNIKAQSWREIGKDISLSFILADDSLYERFISISKKLPLGSESEALVATNKKAARFSQSDLFTLRPFEVVPFAQENPFQISVVENYLSVQARGKNLFFVNESSISSLEANLGQFSTSGLDGFLVNREDFLAVGGFDWSMTNSRLRFSNLNNRLINFRKSSRPIDWASIDVKKNISSKLSHLQWKMSELDFQSPFLKKCASNQSVLPFLLDHYSKKTELVLPAEEIDKLVLEKKPNLWVISSIRFQMWMDRKLTENIYRWYRFTGRMYCFYKSNIWRLHPTSYGVYWKLKHKLYEVSRFFYGRVVKKPKSEEGLQ